MLQFIFSLIFMLALGAILFVFVRALPRLEKEGSGKQNFIERWITSDLPEKVDFTLKNVFVKFLRKTKIIILRVDNVVGARLKKMKISEDTEAAKPDFKEITGNGTNGNGAKEE